MPSDRPVRVLHVFGSLNRGGAETWLMHVFRHLDRTRFAFDFAVHSDRPAAYDAEARELGAAIIPCLQSQRPWAYARNFRRLLAEHGPYDVVHSHVHRFSGFVLRLAAQAGVPVRIAHSHVDPSHDERQAGSLRRLYLGQMSRWLQRHATVGLACSRPAAAALFGANWQADPRFRVLHYAIDLEPFGQPRDKAAARAELGLPPEAFIVGHVGRFAAQKNHAFLVDIIAAAARRDARLHFLLVGDGTLRPAIEEQARALGVAKRITFAGLRADVPRLMCGAMDLFVLPSLFEGLPLVVLEAQAAGLPCVLSDAITDETDVAGELIRRVPLAQGADAWAETLLATAAATPALTPPEALARVTASGFNITHSVGALQQVYAAGALGPRLIIHG